MSRHVVAGATRLYSTISERIGHLHKLLRRIDVVFDCNCQINNPWARVVSTRSMCMTRHTRFTHNVCHMSTA